MVNILWPKKLLKCFTKGVLRVFNFAYFMGTSLTFRPFDFKDLNCFTSLTILLKIAALRYNLPSPKRMTAAYDWKMFLYPCQESHQQNPLIRFKMT